MNEHEQMIINLLDKLPWVEGLKSVNGCSSVAGTLFSIISHHHGQETARRMFSMWGTAPARRDQQKIERYGLLMRYDQMNPPNVQRLVREVAEENKVRPRLEQRGAGNTSFKSLEVLLRRELKKRDERIKSGTWDGPRGGPWLNALLS
jgi:hypothetical protein